MSRGERTALAVFGSVALILLLIAALWPRQALPDKSAKTEPTSLPAPRSEPRSAPSRRPEPPREDPAPEPPVAPSVPPETADTEKPPPITAIILTFPVEMAEDKRQEYLTKCKVLEVRRSGTFIKVVPGPGTSFDQVKRCFRFGDVVAQEERGGPPPGVGR